VIGSLLFGALVAAASADPIEITLWHSYQGAERDALAKALEAFASTNPGFKVAASAVPYDAMRDKIPAAIPRGHGPDVFIYAHDFIGRLAEGGLIEPLELMVDEAMLDRQATACVFALAYGDSLYGLPLAHKALALFVRTDRIKSPPKSYEELVEIAKKETDPSKGRYGLVYPNADFFFHTPLAWSLGAYVMDEKRSPKVANPGMIASLVLAKRMFKDEKIVPDDPTPVTESSMFSDGRTPMVITGPWFRSEIDKNVPYTVVPIPAFPGGKQASGFSTCEGVLMNHKTAHPKEAFQLMRFLSEDMRSVRPRMVIGGQPVTLDEAWTTVLPELTERERAIFRAFKEAFEHSVPSPSDPQMAVVWTPMNAALYKTLHQDMPAEAAAKEAQKRIEDALLSKR
jgi:maltose-binding protein MalE